MAGISYTTSSTPYNLLSMSGGLNSTSGGLNVKDNEATDLLNIDFDVFGSFKKRNGYTALNSTAVNSGAMCTGLHYFQKSDGTQKLLGVFGDRVGRMDDLDGTWDDVTGSITITAGNNNLFSMVTARNTVIFTNNVDAPFTLADTGNAAAATVPTGLTKAKFTTFWNNYAFYANCTVSGALQSSRFYWSDLKDITTWGATHFIDVSIEDGTSITGIKPLGDRLIVFKEKAIYIVTFTGDTAVPFLVSRTQSSVGAISGYSIQDFGNGLIFLAQDGLYLFDGAVSSKLSDRITTTLNTFAKNRFQYAVSGYQREKNRYYISFTTSGSTTNNRVITFDTVNNAFSIYSGMAINAITNVIVNGSERMYFGDYDGFSYRMDTGTSDNPLGVKTAIASYYKTKFFNFDDLVNQKGVPHITIYHTISSTTMQFGYSYDFEDSNQVTESIDLSTSTAAFGTARFGYDTFAAAGGRVIRRDINGRGRTIRFTFTSNTVDETLQIEGLGFYKHLECVN